MIARQALRMINFLIFNQLVNARTDKFHNTKFLDKGSHGHFTLYNSETILNVGLDSCIETCKATKECKYINYHEDARACHFIGVQVESGSVITHNLKQQRGYTFGNKSEWRLERYNVCSECQDQGSCKIEKQQNEHDRYSVCRNSGCGPPPEFEGSDIRGNMYSVGYRVLYECKPGYVTTEHAISTCLENGTWSRSKSVCLQEGQLKGCGSVEVKIDNGNVTLDESDNTMVGATATVSCKESYKPNRNKITCLHNGTWEDAMCFLRDCGSLEEVKFDNGNVTEDEAGVTTVGATATVSCKEVYKPTQTKITCLKNGTWEVAMCSLRGNCNNQTTTALTETPTYLQPENFDICRNYSSVLAYCGIVYNLYEVLCKSILFYEAERSGKLPADQRVTWRMDSTLNDGWDNGVDITGGWFNGAGMIKSTYPMASSATILLWGLLKWSSSYTAAGQLTYMYDSVKWPLDYFLKCWKPDQNRFCVQVGNIYTDNQQYFRPEDIPKSVRRSYFVDTNNGGSDAAADTVSALALGYMVFNNTNSAYADTLLKASKSLFEFANKYRKPYSDSVEDGQNVYTTSHRDSYGDELTQAALWLYKATKNVTYLSKANELYTDFESHFDELPWSYDWKDKRVAVNLLMFEETGNLSYGDRVKSFLQSWSPNGSVEYTPQGLAWRDKLAPLRYVSDVAFMSMLALDQNIISSSDISAGNVLNPYKQIKYILGDSGRSYVVGFGTNSPTNLRHKSSLCAPNAASCDWNEFQEDPNHFILFGALVGGPDEQDNFQDDRQDITQSRVACDINAGFQSSVAGMIALPEGSK